MELHEQLEPLKAFIGTWRGTGFGHYPTITSFEYTEELTFTNVGKPFLVYQQRTWSPTGSPMHVETGYLRHPSPGIIEFILAQPTGQTELAEGTIETSPVGLTISLQARIMNSSTAKTVDATTREYRLVGDDLITSFGMAAVGEPMGNHLKSQLQRTLSE